MTENQQIGGECTMKNYKKDHQAGEEEESEGKEVKYMTKKERKH